MSDEVPVVSNQDLPPVESNQYEKFGFRKFDNFLRPNGDTFKLFKTKFGVYLQKYIQRANGLILFDIIKFDDEVVQSGEESMNDCAEKKFGEGGGRIFRGMYTNEILKMEEIEIKARLLEAAHLLVAMSKRITVPKLHHTLFYGDVNQILNYGEEFTITGAEYLALKKGPRIYKYATWLTEKLESEGYAIKELLNPGEENETTELIYTGKTVDRHQYLGHNDDIFVLIKFYHFPDNFYKENPGWKISWEYGLALGKPAEKICMSLAIQQLME